MRTVESCPSRPSRRVSMALSSPLPPSPATPAELSRGSWSESSRTGRSAHPLGPSGKPTSREKPKESALSMSDTATDIGGLEEAKEAIVARGRERGFVTSEDLLEGLPVDD